MAEDAGWERALVPEQLRGERLDRAAAALFSQYSRAAVRKALDAGLLRIEGKSWDGGAGPRPRTPVAAGAVLLLRMPRDEAAAAAASPTPAEIPLELLHEDEAFLVVNKPAGLVAHPGPGHAGDTLVNALLWRDASLASLPRAGLVHRLDRDTSGLLLVARLPQALRALQEALRRRRIRRLYRVLVRGRPLAGGEIRTGIQRHPRQRQRMMAVEEGAPGSRPALSSYRVAERFRDHVELEVALGTGRTHQVRVHMAHAGMPVVGDQDYGGRLAIPAGASPPLQRALRTARRQMLHAWRLELEHPLDGQPMRFQAPPPADYLRLLALLRENSD